MTAIEAGKFHEKARSFTAKEMARYESTKAYRDQSIAWCVATRGWYPCEVVDSWDMIQWPMNQFRTGRLTIKGMEVAAAYNTLVKLTTDKKTAEENFGDYAKHVLKTKFILTTEEDNIIPPDAIQKMLAAIFECPDCGLECGGPEWRCPKGHKGYDGIGGLYSVKSNPPIPMAFGNPKKGTIDFKPRSVKRAVNAGKVLEVNGLAQGCTLFRKGLFKQVSYPWFETTNTQTQDLFFAAKALKEAKARFGVHCGVLVGHLDVNTGEVI
jgi:hypothetical protein